MHSFSSLKNGRLVRVVESSAVDEAATGDVVIAGEAPADRVEQDFDALPPSPELGELAFVAGAEFGNALHQVFEKRRIGEPISAQLDLIDTSLRDFGVRLGDMSRVEAVARIARRVQAALDADLGDGIRLGELPVRALRAEMGFYYPVRGISVPALRAACEAYGIGFPQGPLQELEGLMHGKIDLVFEHQGRFHVLDYKGNRLGDSATGGVLADYAPAALDGEMKQENYDLQALLYTVALDRFLRQRIRGYDRNLHLGDTIYLFVRAAGLAPRAGVWRQRFDDGLLDAVDAALAGNPGQATPQQVQA
jgi:exodeoxyribonuclease V beta subunit